MRVDEHVSARRIGGGAAPVHAARAAGELNRRLRRRAFLVKAERRERPGVVEPAALVPEFLARLHVIGGRVVGRHHVFLLELDARQRRRLHGERLRRRIPLAGDVALRHGPLLDAEDRFAGHAIEDEHVAGLADGGERRNRPAVLADVHQRRRRRHVRVPEIVVHGLEVPLVLARLGIHRDHRVRVQVAAGAIAAPVVGGRPGDRHVEDAALFVHRHVPAPDVHARAALPAVVRPRLVTGFAGPRHGVEFPELLPGARVERPRVAGRTIRHFADRRAERDDVLEDEGHAVPRHADIGDPVGAEPFRRLPGRRVERHQPRAARFALRGARREHHALWVVAIARPVREPRPVESPSGMA